MKVRKLENTKSKIKNLFLNPQGSKIKTFMIITGENPDTISTPENNKLYNQNLKDKISFKGINSIESDIASSFLPYDKVKGKFSGNTEHSFIIYNCSHFDAECLAKSCRQQSFIFGTNDNGKLTFEMWANKSKNDYHYKKVDEKDLYIDRSEAENDYTKICKDFKFSIPFDVFEVAPEEMIETIENNIKSNRFSEEKFNEYLDESLSEKYTGKYRMYVRATLYREG